MPEGDTIFRTARALNRALAGHTVTVFESVYPALMRVDEDAPLAGRAVVGVKALGKHLLIEFSGGLTLRTHLRMNGRWHLYQQGEPWHAPRSAVRVVIATARHVAVAFDVQVAEFVTARGLARHAVMAALGPDLLSETFDEGEALRRLDRAGEMTVAEAVLNQRIVAGIGNVFKCEILFVCRISPFRPVASLSDEERVALLRCARRLLTANVAEGSERPPAPYAFRRTTPFVNPGARLWVYGRPGRPCRRCGSAILSRKQGPDARLTFWCPLCQPQPQEPGMTPSAERASGDVSAGGVGRNAGLAAARTRSRVRGRVREPTLRPGGKLR